MTSELAKVRRRLILMGAVDRLSPALLFACGALLAHVLLHKWLYLPWSAIVTILAVLIAAVPPVLFALRRNLPTMEMSAVAVDRAMKSKDRFRTALYCRAEGIENAFAQTLLGEVNALKNRIDPSACVPLRCPRRVQMAFACAALAVLFARILPEPATPLFLSTSETRIVEQALASLEETARNLDEESRRSQDEALKALAAELREAGRELEGELPFKDRTLAGMEKMAAKLESEKARMETEEAKLREKIADELSKAGFGAEAEMLRNGDRDSALASLLSKLESGSLTEAQKADLADAVEKAAASSEGKVAEELREAARAMKRGDESGAANALKRAGTCSASKGAACEMVRDQAAKTREAREKITGSGPSANPRRGAGTGRDRFGRKSDSGSQQLISADATSGRAGAVCVAGDGTVGAGTGTTNQRQAAAPSGRMRHDRRPPASMQYADYVRIYAPDLIDADGQDALVEGAGGGPEIEMDVSGPALPPGTRGSSKAPSGRGTAAYSRAASAAMEVEEIPGSDREFVRDYFDDVINGNR
ncbi:MAG: hypothetical protein AAB229_02605 [Candidatus Hydrogenedentota bacterium]